MHPCVQPILSLAYFKLQAYYDPRVTALLSLAYFKLGMALNAAPPSPILSLAYFKRGVHGIT